MTLTTTTDILKPSFDNIPNELAVLPQWVLWKASPNKNNPDKLDKVPHSAKTKRRVAVVDSGKDKWSTLTEVQAAYSAGGFDGIGFVFTVDDNYVGFDVDGVDTNNTPEHIQDILDSSYAELSPSGSGYHVIMKGKLPEGCNKKNTKLGLEIYDNERFFTFTGNAVNKLPVKDTQVLIDTLADKYFTPQLKQNKEAAALAEDATLEDNTLLSIMFKSNPELHDLYVTGSNNEQSMDNQHSSADLALCNYLAFWTAKNPKQIDRLFRGSALMRPKWERREYREGTIRKAIQGTNDVFTPNSNTTAVEREEENIPPVEEWLNQLEVNKDKIVSSVANIELILNNDDDLKGRFALNTFSNKIEVVGSLPWKRTAWSNSITDTDMSCLRNYLSKKYDISGKEKINDVFYQVVSENSFHPIKDYFSSIRGTWDGKPRLDTLFIDFFDSPNTELNKMQTRLTLVGAIKRIYEPGCKWDTVLVTKGEQGVGKSSFFQKLAVNQKWFNDSLHSLEGKDTIEQMQGSWIIELGEMSAVKKSEQNLAKAFITRQVDNVRFSYAKYATENPRQCIFMASTNDETPLKDETGGRRWWIIDVKSRWYDKPFNLDVNQVWAEALEVYEKMTSTGAVFILPRHLEEEAKRVQADNTDYGVYAGEIEMALVEGSYMEYKYESGRTEKVSFEQTCARHLVEKVLRKEWSSLAPHDRNKITALINKNPLWKKLDKRKRFGEYGLQTVYTRQNSPK